MNQNIRHVNETSVWRSVLNSSLSWEKFWFFQLCVLEFGSWSYDRTQVDIDWWFIDKFNASSPYVDFSDYVISNEWVTDGFLERDISPNLRKLQTPSEKYIRNRTFVLPNGKRRTKFYPTLRYKVRMRRNPSFYFSFLVLPCILLSSLTLVLFWLPPESPAKMMLGKTEREGKGGEGEGKGGEGEGKRERTEWTYL